LPGHFPAFSQLQATSLTAYAVTADDGHVFVWGDDIHGQFGFGPNPPLYETPYPYPAAPEGAEEGEYSTLGSEIPQRLGRLKSVSWLGVGSTGVVEIAPTDSALRAAPGDSGGLSFFSHSIGSLSARVQAGFISQGDPSTITSVKVIGPAKNDFELVSINTSGDPNDRGTLPITLGEGDTLTVFVRFVPTAAGDRLATVEVKSSDGETATLPLTGFGVEPTELVSPTGPKGDSGAKGDTGPGGPAGKNGVVVFAATRSRISAKRGKTASLGFLLVNGTSAKLDGATVHAAVPRALGGPSVGAIGIPSLRAGASRQIKVPLKIGDRAKLGIQSVKVAFKAGDKTVTRTVSVRVEG
jgi:hypothetical protein